VNGYTCSPAEIARDIEFCECQFVTIVIDIVHDSAISVRRHVCHPLEQALSKPVVSVFLIMLPSTMDRKLRSTRIGAAVRCCSVSQKESRPPRVTVSGLDVEAPSGRWTLRRINGKHAVQSLKLSEFFGLYVPVAVRRSSAGISGSTRNSRCLP
jgi:hypothetical protein